MPGWLISPKSGHMSTLGSGKAGFDFHSSLSGGRMIVCAGLSGLASAPSMKAAGKDERSVASKRSRRLVAISSMIFPPSSKRPSAELEFKASPHREKPNAGHDFARRPFGRKNV